MQVSAIIEINSEINRTAMLINRIAMLIKSVGPKAPFYINIFKTAHDNKMIN
jgi:hypothetical protein